VRRLDLVSFVSLPQDDFKQQLNKFKCSDSGPAGYFLSFNNHRDRQAWKLGTRTSMTCSATGAI
jgi:hypothetical protein